LEDYEEYDDQDDSSFSQETFIELFNLVDDDDFEMDEDLELVEEVFNTYYGPFKSKAFYALEHYSDQMIFKEN
jgi:hypothetical protein